VVLDGERVVAATSTVRLDFDFQHVDHTFRDVIQGGWLTSHQPAGEWPYGADMGVAPDYRRRGLGTALYAARQETVWRLGLKGQVTAGMIRDYGAVRDRMPAQEYLQAVVEGRVKDSTCRCSWRSDSNRARCLPTT
jgi:GNAT superfamily N-acetyltransferase